MTKQLIYKIEHQYNVGTEENPIIETELRGAVAFANESNFDEVYSRAVEQAYNGEITVEEIPDPETPPSLESRIASLEAENAQLKASNAALEDAICELDVMLCGGAE